MNEDLADDLKEQKIVISCSSEDMDDNDDYVSSQIEQTQPEAVKNIKLVVVGNSSEMPKDPSDTDQKDDNPERSQS